MKKISRKRKFQFQIINKSSLIRLSVVFLVVAILSIWAWTTMIWMPSQSYKGKLYPLSEKEVTLQKSLEQNIKKLAVEIGIRDFSHYDQLNQAKEFLSNSFTKAGYQVNLKPYKIVDKSYYNIEVEHRGKEKPSEIIVVGAHYDSVIGPGANDNATGAAATLELARLFAKKTTARTIRFVEFTNEEPPFFWSEDMGSLVYAKESKQKEENIVAMLSLETMGYFSEEIDSQKYPFPANWFYPNRGNFIAFVGNLNSCDLLRQAIASFRRQTQFPSEGTCLPSSIPGIGWSDHWSFWQQGYQGIMITDTAIYRYPYYHTQQDSVDKIDFDKLARIVNGLETVILELAG